MSAFLGKIHFWLYNKIKLQEDLINMVIDLAIKKSYDSENLLKESYSKFGAPTVGKLEDEIDNGNIHGWLQGRIISAENRFAYVVTELLNNNVLTKEEIAEGFYKNAEEIMKGLDLKAATPEDLFYLVFDNMIEGMPCDFVNKITEVNENFITWETTKDLHKAYWNTVSGDVENYYYFRDSWIKGFLNASPTDYKYTRTNNNINTIGRA